KISVPVTMAARKYARFDSRSRCTTSPTFTLESVQTRNATLNRMPSAFRRWVFTPSSLGEREAHEIAKLEHGGTRGGVAGAQNVGADFRRALERATAAIQELFDGHDLFVRQRRGWRERARLERRKARNPALQQVVELTAGGRAHAGPRVGCRGGGWHRRGRRRKAIEAVHEVPRAGRRIREQCGCGIDRGQRVAVQRADPHAPGGGEPGHGL